MTNSTAPELSENPLAPLPQLLRAWSAIGWQSFGGGMSTLTLIQRTFVQQRRWLTPEQFVRMNAISQVVPGINLLSVAIQIGDELGGAAGIAISLLGLLLPSVAITIVMTAAFASVQSLPVVQAAFRGIVPATIGLGALTVWTLLRALLREGAIIGGQRETVAAMIVVAFSAAMIALHAPVIGVLTAGGAVMSIARWLATRGRDTSVVATEFAAEALAEEAEASDER